MKDTDLLALLVRNRELEAQLAEAQDQAIELAVDAGELHAAIGMLEARLAEAERDRDSWRAEAERARRAG